MLQQLRMILDEKKDSYENNHSYDTKLDIKALEKVIGYIENKKKNTIKITVFFGIITIVNIFLLLIAINN